MPILGLHRGSPAFRGFFNGTAEKRVSLAIIFHKFTAPGQKIIAGKQGAVLIGKREEITFPGGLHGSNAGRRVEQRGAVAIRIVPIKAANGAANG